MLAMAIKEFRQLRRDRRTLAMLVVLPLVLLTVFGYAASFDVPSVRTIVVGPRAEAVAARVPAQLDVVAVRPADGRAEAVRELRDGRAGVALVTGGGDAAGGAPVTALVDGADLFSARAAVQALTQRPGAGQAAGGPRVVPEVLFNPELRTPVIMVPGLVGIILVFVGTMATALGVVRERQSGTLEQLAVMPFRGSVAVFALGALLFLFVTLGLGVLISTVSENQGQAIQLAIMTLLPQVLLSGLIFPLHAMAAGVRWIGYVLPLTYFIQIARGVMVRGTPLEALAVPLLALAGLGLAVFTLSVVRFRRDLAPAGRPGEREPRPEREPATVGGAP